MRISFIVFCGDTVTTYVLYFLTYPMYMLYQIFRGPADHKKRVVQLFIKPVEARYVRWNPLTWHNAIAMKVDLLGCGELTTEVSTLTTGFTSPTSYGM